jgi:hypothetical protein
MERVDALQLLPEAYRRALQLCQNGADEPAIAAELGIVPEAVALLLRLAEIKLSRLLEDDTTPGAIAAGAEQYEQPSTQEASEASD